MIYALFALGLLALAAVAVFVWTAIRTAVRQVSDNRAVTGTVTAYWTRAVDLDAVPVDEPLTGETARAVGAALRTPPRKLGRGYDELNAATGGRTWDELSGHQN